MSTYEYIFKLVDPAELDELPDEDGEGIPPTGSGHYNWDVVKAVARRYCTERQYQALLLRGDYGMKYHEIAVVMNLSKSGAQDLLRRATKSIARRFAKHDKLIKSR